MLAFYLNAAGSLLAAGCNLYGVRYGDPALRGLRAAIGALAGFYFAGYLWVINAGDILTWSTFYRRVSPVAWLLAWCLPPIIGSHTHQQTKRAIKATTQALEQTLENEIPR